MSLLSRLLAVWLSGAVLSAQVGGGGVSQQGTKTKTPSVTCQQLTNPVDAAVQNQWNVITCAVPANTLVADGDQLDIQVGALLSANTNTREFQFYWSLASATCSGTGASLCNSGCQLQQGTTTTNAAQALGSFSVIRTGAGAQKKIGTMIVTAGIGSTATCSIDETQATQVVAGFRNTTAAAASVTSATINVFYFPK